MSDIAIRVENLGKRYRIGRARQLHGTTSASLSAGLRDALIDRVTRLKVGRSKVTGSTPLANPSPGSGLALQPSNLQPFDKLRAGSSTEFWALRDVSFEVKQGEVLGIIGRNGAGKSTLLKILSRITDPTEGWAEINGRVGSLLEVGTGFHPELTGRENIYLNGAILGMKRGEIDRRFDEIVAFSEVEKFLDTPVKRYSSGMYVRLAFAVAAHLEPEILLVDEVLAVGDAAFQKKCLGKMGDVAKQGRTVLFVSHNMAAVRTLCSRSLYLSSGSMLLDADSETVVSHYLAQDTAASALIAWDIQTAPRSAELRFLKAFITNDGGEPSPSVDCRCPFFIVAEYEVLRPVEGVRIGFMLQNLMGVVITGSSDWGVWSQESREPGHYVSRCLFPGYTLNAGTYSVLFGAEVAPYTEQAVLTPYCISFTVEDVDGHGPRHGPVPGVLRPKLNWEVECISKES